MIEIYGLSVSSLRNTFIIDIYACQLDVIELVSDVYWRFEECYLRSFGKVDGVFFSLVARSDILPFRSAVICIPAYYAVILPVDAV